MWLCGSVRLLVQGTGVQNYQLPFENFVHPTLHVSLFTPLYMCLCSPHFTCVFVHPIYMCLCSPHLQKSLKAVGAFFLAGTGEVN